MFFQLLPANFDYKDLSGKAKCKEALQKRMGLPVKKDVPLIGIVTRLADQKGIAEVFAPSYGSIYSICSNMEVQFAILGSGEKWCEDEINALQAKLPNLSTGSRPLRRDKVPHEHQGPQTCATILEICTSPQGHSLNNPQVQSCSKLSRITYAAHTITHSALQ